MTKIRNLPRMRKGHGDPKFCSCLACKALWENGGFNAKGEWEAASEGPKKLSIERAFDGGPFDGKLPLGFPDVSLPFIWKGQKGKYVHGKWITELVVA